jgi:hypothetical protein
MVGGRGIVVLMIVYCFFIGSIGGARLFSFTYFCKTSLSNGRWGLKVVISVTMRHIIIFSEFCVGLIISNVGFIFRNELFSQNYC